jgi:hypothetical protein
VGSRKIELLSKSVSTYSDHPENANWIIQKGVAKDKNDNGLDRTVAKPLIGINNIQFHTGLKKLRAMIGKDSKLNNAALGKKYGDLLAEQAKKVFPEHVAKRSSTGTHLHRALYGNASFDTVSHKPMSRNAWLSSVLGHKEGSLGTSLSYQGVRVTSALPATERTVTERIALLEANLKTLKRQREEEPPRSSSSSNASSGVKRIRSGLDKEIIMYDVMGAEVKMTKLRKSRHMNDDQKKARIKQAKALLVSKNIALTNTNLRGVGLGSILANLATKKL